MLTSDLGFHFTDESLPAMRQLRDPGMLDDTEMILLATSVGQTGHREVSVGWSTYPLKDVIQDRLNGLEFYWEFDGVGVSDFADFVIDVGLGRRTSVHRR